MLYLKTLYVPPPYWGNIKSPIGRSTALTPIGRSKSRCTTPPYIGPPTVCECRKMIAIFPIVAYRTCHYICTKMQVAGEVSFTSGAVISGWFP